MLFLTTIDPDHIKREFNCAFTSMEANFEFLNAIVAEGNTLVDAYILEGTSRTELPVAAFDGLPVSEGMRALQQEWEEILSEPTQPASAHRLELIEVVQQRLSQLEGDILTHERMIDWYVQWLQRTQSGRVSEPTRSRLIHQYKTQLENHQVLLAKARFQTSLAAKRLSQLLTQ